MRSLFLVNEIPTTDVVEVRGEEAHHALKVLRLKAGDEILLSDGAGNWVGGEISLATSGAFQVSVRERGYSPTASPELVVVQALPKSDRVKEAIELLTQAGADTIIPWQAERSISQWKSESGDKWRNALIAATKQSRRFRIPTLAPLLVSSQIIHAHRPGDLWLVFHEAVQTQLSSLINAQRASAVQRIVLVIGPEGGITDDEIAKFLALPGELAHLGDPIFRSAHAGAAALAAVQALIGRW